MRTWWVAFIPVLALPGASYSGPDAWTEPDRIEIPHLTYRWNHDARPDADPGMKGTVAVEIDNLVLRKLRYATTWSFGGGVAEFKDMPRKIAPDSVFASKTAGVWVTSKHDPHKDVVATAISMAELERGLKCDTEDELPDCINNPRFTRYVGVDLALDSHQGARDFFDPAAKPGGPKTEDAKMKVLARALHDKVDLARIVANARGPGLAIQKQQTRVFAVAHELGHALGASHHDFFKPADPNSFVAQASGAFACPMRYWQNLVERDFPGLIAFFDGKWDPSKEAADGSAYHFCSDNLEQMSLQP